MMWWILIFYIDGSFAGGPATAQFQNKQACLAADKILAEKWNTKYRGICISTTYSDQRGN